MRRRQSRGAISVRTAFLLPCLLLLSLPLSQTWQLEKTLEELDRRQIEDHKAVLTTLRNLVASDLSLLGNETVLNKSFASNVLPFFAPPVTAEIDLDGRLNEWQNIRPTSYGAEDILTQSASELSLAVDLRMVQQNDNLLLFFDVTDDQVVYREISNISIHRNDHIRLAMVDENGQFNRYTLATQQPGTLYGRVVSSGGRSLRREPQIEAFWRATDLGYQVEVKISPELHQGAIAINVADVDSLTSREIRHVIGSSRGDSPETLSPVLEPSERLSELLRSLRLDHVSFIDRFGNPLAAPESATSGQPQTLPLIVNDIHYGDFIYHLDQTANDTFIMQQRQQLLVFSAVMLGLGVLLSLFLARHQMARIKQLGVALEAVVDDQGRVQGSLGKPVGDDAIGDLGQRFTDITERLQQYNEYLELLSRRLAHELRTPVSVVRSSLENLATSVDERNLKYVQRANNGVARLTNILNSMSEASRLEQTLDHDEVIVFDLAGVVRGCFEGYEQAFPLQAFELIIECDESQVTGIPELFAQMLDKLIDNAAQFSEPDQAIIVRLSEETETLLVRVSNSGPGLPDTMSKELFDPMISVRDASASEDSHLGMGLYVARLIAEFHGGSIELKNREDREGVVATVRVPMLRITSKLA